MSFINLKNVAVENHKKRLVKEIMEGKPRLEAFDELAAIHLKNGRRYAAAYINSRFKQKTFKKGYYSVFFQADFLTAHFQPIKFENTQKFNQDFKNLLLAIDAFKENELALAERFMDGLSPSFQNHTFLDGLRFLLIQNQIPTYQILKNNFYSYAQFNYRDFLERTLDWCAYHFANQNDDSQAGSLMEHSYLLAFLGEINLHRFVHLYHSKKILPEMVQALLSGITLIHCAQLINFNLPKLNYQVFIDRALNRLSPEEARSVKNFISEKKDVLEKSYIHFNLQNDLDWRSPVDFVGHSYYLLIMDSLNQIDRKIEQSIENWSHYDYNQFTALTINILDLISRLFVFQSLSPQMDLGLYYDDAFEKLNRILKIVQFVNPKQKKIFLKDFQQKNSSPFFKKFVQSEKIVKEFFKKLS